MDNFLRKYFGRKPGRKLIFRPYFTRNGRTYFARDYGKKAFAMWVKA